LRVDYPFQERRDANAEVSREIIGLIEAALIFAAPMQRNRHDKVGIAQEPGTGCSHQASKRPGNRSALLVFQRMDDFFHTSVIAIDRARPVDALVGPQPIEERRRKMELGPAVFAHRAIQRMRQRLSARRAWRLEEGGKDLIG
jgi:hypothetical protein